MLPNQDNSSKTISLLEMAREDGLRPTKVPKSTKSKCLSYCPGCCGQDAFIIWDVDNQYYCTQCQRRGDPIQYLRDFHAMSHNEACAKLGIFPNTASSTSLWKEPCQDGCSFLPNKPIVLLDSELEALTVEKFAGDICVPISLGNIPPLLLISLQTQTVEWPLSIISPGIEIRRQILKGIRHGLKQRPSI